MNIARLGVNIDHVATLRQQRGEVYPSITDAARLTLQAGADQITIHLREDRRHIQDFDVPAVKKITDEFGKPLNLEIGANSEIVGIALQTKPAWLCLVPEKREERTTEGGLNILDKVNRDKISEVCNLFADKSPETKISLFVEAEEETLKICRDLPIHAVEIHTGDYAIAFNQGKDLANYFEQFKKGREIVGDKIGYHAGHGLTDKSLIPLVERDLFAEYNIGHWIIADAVFCGLEKSIKKLIDIIQKA